MRLTRSRAVVSVLAVGCAAAVGGGAVIAQGQAPAPPAPPTGTLEVEVTTRQADSGYNAANPRARGIRIADVTAANGRITGPGALRGTTHFIQVITDRGTGGTRPRAFKLVALATFDFGNGDTLIGSAIVSPPASGRPEPVPGTILGGTGRFAGARGVGVQTFISRTRTTERSRFTFTFMP
jgi:hypothetical protein